MNFSGRKDNAGRAQVKIIQSTKKIHRRSEGMKVPCSDRALLSLAHRPQCAAFLQGQEVVHLEYHIRIIVGKCTHKEHAKMQAAPNTATKFNQINMLANSKGRGNTRHNRSENRKE